MCLGDTRNFVVFRFYRIHCHGGLWTERITSLVVTNAVCLKSAAPLASAEVYLMR